MIPLSALLATVATGLLVFLAAAALVRKLISDALRKSEARSVERMRALEARTREQLRQQESRMQQQTGLAAKEAEAARRAENNLLEVAKGLTAASIRFDERLKTVERRCPDPDAS